MMSYIFTENGNKGELSFEQTFKQRNRKLFDIFSLELVCQSQSDEF